MKRVLPFLILLLLAAGGYWAYDTFIAGPAVEAEIRALKERSAARKTPPEPPMTEAPPAPPAPTIPPAPALPQHDFSSELAFPFPGGWPCQIVSVPGAGMMEVYAKLCKEGRPAGYWPILVGDLPGSAPQRSEDAVAKIPELAADIITASQIVHLEDYLAQSKAAYDQVPPIPPTPEAAPAPAPPPALALAERRDLITGPPLPQVWIALVPTVRSYEAPAYLNWGGGGKTRPSPEYQVAFLRRWQAAYGAEVVAITGNTVQCVVARPPATEADALALAYEQFAYCPDVITKGTGTVQAHATALMGAKVWYFWWE